MYNMDIMKIKFKSGNLSGKKEQEGTFIKVQAGYIPITLKTESLIEGFGEVIREIPIIITEKGEIFEG